MSRQKTPSTSAPRIARIAILPFNMVNAYLIHGANTGILVDTGLPGSEAKVAKVLARNGLEFRDIKLIVITHAHVDHAGSAYALREATGAPIVAHGDDVKHFTHEVPMTYCPTGWAGRLFHKSPVPHKPYAGFVPDGIEKFYMGHGGPLTAAEVRRHAATLLDMPCDRNDA